MFSLNINNPTTTQKTATVSQKIARYKWYLRTKLTEMLEKNGKIPNREEIWEAVLGYYEERNFPKLSMMERLTIGLFNFYSTSMALKALFKVENKGLAKGLCILNTHFEMQPQIISPEKDEALAMLVAFFSYYPTLTHAGLPIPEAVNRSLKRYRREYHASLNASIGEYFLDKINAGDIKACEGLCDYYSRLPSRLQQDILKAIVSKLSPAEQSSDYPYSNLFAVLESIATDIPARLQGSFAEDVFQLLLKKARDGYLSIDEEIPDWAIESLSKFLSLTPEAKRDKLLQQLMLIVDEKTTSAIISAALKVLNLHIHWLDELQLNHLNQPFLLELEEADKFLCSQKRMPSYSPTISGLVKLSAFITQPVIIEKLIEMLDHKIYFIWGVLIEHRDKVSDELQQSIDATLLRNIDCCESYFSALDLPNRAIAFVPKAILSAAASHLLEQIHQKEVGSNAVNILMHLSEVMPEEFQQRVSDSLEALTKDEKCPYREYIQWLGKLIKSDHKAIHISAKTCAVLAPYILQILNSKKWDDIDYTMYLLPHVIAHVSTETQQNFIAVLIGLLYEAKDGVSHGIMISLLQLGPYLYSTVYKALASKLNTLLLSRIYTCKVHALRLSAMYFEKFEALSQEQLLEQAFPALKNDCPLVSSNAITALASICNKAPGQTAIRIITKLIEYLEERPAFFGNAANLTLCLITHAMPADRLERLFTRTLSSAAKAKGKHASQFLDGLTRMVCKADDELKPRLLGLLMNYPMNHASCRLIMQIWIHLEPENKAFLRVRLDGLFHVAKDIRYWCLLKQNLIGKTIMHIDALDLIETEVFTQACEANAPEPVMVTIASFMR